MIAALTLTLSLLTTPPVDTIRVGDVSALALSVGTDTVDNYVRTGGERRRVVTYVQTISEVPEGYMVVQKNIGAQGAVLSLDSLVLRRGTLATVWHGDVTPMGSRHVAFAAGRVRGTAVDTLGQASAVDQEIPSGLFDYSVVTLVADRLPLAAGFEATLATYDITRGPQNVHIHVAGLEQVTVAGKTFDAWRMEVDFGGPPVTRWVDRETRRELRFTASMGEQEITGEARIH